MKGIFHSLLLFVLVLAGEVNGWAVPLAEPESGIALEERAADPENPPPEYTSTTSTTTTTTSTTCLTGTDYDTLTTTAYVKPTCSGTITYVTTVVTAFDTYIVGTTYYNERVSLKYYVSGTSTYSVDSAITTDVTYVPGPPGPGPKTATAPATARPLNTLPRPCVAIMLTKTVSYEPEIQTQVYLRETVSAFYAWTATTGTKTVLEVETCTSSTTIDVYTGITLTEPYTKHTLETLYLTDAPPAEDPTSTETPTPTPEVVVVNATTTTVAEVESAAPAPAATGAAVSKAAGGVGVALAVGVVVVLGL